MIAKGCLHRWTYEARLCYKLGCTCSRCTNRTLETPCQMRNVVFELVRTLGIPPEGLEDRSNNIKWK